MLRNSRLGLNGTATKKLRLRSFFKAVLIDGADFLLALAGALVLLVVMHNAKADGPAPAAEPDYQALAKQGMDRAKEYQGQVQQELPKVPVYPNMDQVKAMADIGRERGQAEFDALKNGGKTEAAQLALPPGTINPILPPGASKPKVPGLVVVAVSSSMPLQMLRDYMAQLDGVPGVVVVIRGFIGGAHLVKPTGSWMEEVLRENPGCFKCRHRDVHVVVDPLIFQALGIQQVPAVAYLDGVQQLQHCEQEVFASASVAFGSASVASALKAVNKGGVPVPKAVLASFDGKGWEAK